jgi:hypothetical protein
MPRGSAPRWDKCETSFLIQPFRDQWASIFVKPSHFTSPTSDASLLSSETPLTPGQHSRHLWCLMVSWAYDAGTPSTHATCNLQLCVAWGNTREQCWPWGSACFSVKEYRIRRSAITPGRDPPYARRLGRATPCWRTDALIWCPTIPSRINHESNWPNHGGELKELVDTWRNTR